MIDESTQQIGGWIGAIGVALFTMQKIWRAARREQVETHRDTAEINMMALLREQAAVANERADRAFAERNNAMEELGRLRGEVATLRAMCLRMESEIDELRRRGR